MVITVPRIVAKGTVFSAFLVPSIGIVADSIPRNAKKVIAVVIVRASKFDKSDVFRGEKLFISKTKKLIKMVKTSGKILRIDVIN